jgi:8-oxo-dGTP pyrophosphatase MutT (NUDIX family)
MIVRFDPETLPPDPEFESRRGPAVPAERLSLAALRARFARQAALAPEQRDSFAQRRDDGIYLRPGQPLRPAAVLVGLVGRDSGAQLLLTRRSERLSDHAGQISFPGGRVEAEDASAAAAALREAREEIGLESARVEILGTLCTYRTVSAFEVTPVVGWIDPAVTLSADPLEVDECFEVPLAYLMDGANYQQRVIEQGSLRRTVLAIEYTGARRYLIWGATAAMLRNFYHFLLDDATIPSPTK